MDKKLGFYRYNQIARTTPAAPFSVDVLIAFNKPFGVLSQFTPDGSPNQTLAPFGFPKNVYSLGRLDADSEGLLLLSDEKGLNNRLLDPENQHSRVYWVQIERIPSPNSLSTLSVGPVVQGRKCLSLQAWILDPQPIVPPRNPPIRVRKSVADCWIGMRLREGKNRQIRRMTASIGHPTLRLIRIQIGDLKLDGLPVGAWRELSDWERNLVFL